jgi:hypothetical protein
MTIERLAWEWRGRLARCFRNPYCILITYAFLGVAFCLVMALCSGCAGDQSRKVQAGVADAIARSANIAEPVIVEGYRRALFRCLDTSKERTEYEVCRAKADHQWVAIRLAWGHLRMAQDEYATALEKGNADVTTYLQWITIAYCEFKSYVPKDAPLPAIAGLVCAEHVTP